MQIDFFSLQGLEAKLIWKAVYFSTRSRGAKTDSKQGSGGPKLKHHRADWGYVSDRRTGKLCLQALRGTGWAPPPLGGRATNPSQERKVETCGT